MLGFGLAARLDGRNRQRRVCCGLWVVAMLDGGDSRGDTLTVKERDRSILRSSRKHREYPVALTGGSGATARFRAINTLGGLRLRS